MDEIHRAGINLGKRMKYFLIILVVLYMGCAGTREPVKEEPIVESLPRYDESFDPLTLNDDDIIIVAATNNQAQKTDPKTPVKQETVLKEINGFRVQILATKNIETASLFEQEATERFESLEQKTYLVFEAPLYKIRIGDCKDRTEAEQLRDTAKQYGYREAFIVKSKIQIQE
jgi:hypothetical protein